MYNLGNVLNCYMNNGPIYTYDKQTLTCYTGKWGCSVQSTKNQYNVYVTLQRGLFGLQICIM